MYIVCFVPYLPLICNHFTTPSKRGEADGLFQTHWKSEVSADKKVKLPPKRWTKHDIESPNGEVSNGQCITKISQSQNEKPPSLAKPSVGVTTCPCFVAKQSAEKITLIETIWFSVIFGTILFGMNYVFNASMVYTTQGSSTVLSTLSTPFCFIFSAIFLKEPLVLSSLVGVAMVLGGSVWITSMDGRSSTDGVSDGNTGDLFAVLAAFIYGFYSVLMKLWIKDDRRLSMFLYIGLVGIWNTITLWPFFFVLDYVGFEKFQQPGSPELIGFLVLNGIMNILFEICWTRLVLLISPLIACVGLGLSVPLSLAADYVIYGITRDYMYWLAAFCVVAGFVLTNVKTRQRVEQNSEIEQPLSTELLKD